MSHRGGPDHVDVSSSWFGSLAPLVLLCRVWRMARLGFSGRSPGVHVPLRSTPVGVWGPQPSSVGGGGPAPHQSATGAKVAVKSEASGLESG